MEVLTLIHLDLCESFPTASRNGQQYFITFINGYSRYGYLDLIHEKSQSLNVFKTFKVEVKNKLNKRIKKIKTLSLTMVVNTLVDLMDQVNNVMDHLLDI